MRENSKFVISFSRTIIVTIRRVSICCERRKAHPHYHRACKYESANFLQILFHVFLLSSDRKICFLSKQFPVTKELQLSPGSLPGLVEGRGLASSRISRRTAMPQSAGSPAQREGLHEVRNNASIAPPHLCKRCFFRSHHRVILFRFSCCLDTKINRTREFDWQLAGYYS